MLLEMASCFSEEISESVGASRQAATHGGRESAKDNVAEIT